jgi:hypothetical protein
MVRFDDLAEDRATIMIEAIPTVGSKRDPTPPRHPLRSAGAQRSTTKAAGSGIAATTRTTKTRTPSTIVGPARPPTEGLATAPTTATTGIDGGMISTAAKRRHRRPRGRRLGTPHVAQTIAAGDGVANANAPVAATAAPVEVAGLAVEVVVVVAGTAAATDPGPAGTAVATRSVARRRRPIPTPGSGGST